MNESQKIALLEELSKESILLPEQCYNVLEACGDLKNNYSDYAITHPISIMMAIVKREFKKAGFDGTTDLIKQLSFGTYNQKFKPNRTEADWLCSDVSALDAYLADPLVRKNISAGLFWELLGSMKRSGTAFEYDGWDTSLPILLISGQEDPVGNAGKGVWTIYNRMKKVGMENVTLKLLPNARHDIFHEDTNNTAEEVRAALTKWIRR